MPHNQNIIFNFQDKKRRKTEGEKTEFFSSWCFIVILILPKFENNPNFKDEGLETSAGYLIK